MASGRKNYFRHSFFARNDEFICGLIEKFGLQGYFYYFALLEMCGEQSSENLQTAYKFHKRILVHNLRLNTRKLNLFLGYLQDMCKISYTYTENQYEIIIPNFAKYLGKYQTKNDSNTPNKRKEKKIKENKIKKEEKQSFSELALEILEHLNAKRKELLPNAKGFSKSHLKEIQARINDGATREDLIFVIENKALDPFFIDSQYKYYRPQTLFNKTKYNNYISEQPLKSFEQADKELGDWLRSIQDNAQ